MCTAKCASDLSVPEGWWFCGRMAVVLGDLVAVKGTVAVLVK